MAARLIALLPRRSDLQARAPVSSVNLRRAAFARVVMTVILFLIFLILLIGSPFGNTPAPLTAPAQTSPKSASNLPTRVAPVHKP